MVGMFYHIYVIGKMMDFAAPERKVYWAVTTGAPVCRMYTGSQSSYVSRQ